MALVLKDRVKETTTTTGTGTYTLAGAVTGYQSFSAIGNANTTLYTVTDGTNWEVGLGTYTSSGTTLSRDTILESSSSGTAVDWGVGVKEVFVTYPAESAVYVNGSGNIVGASAATVAIANGGTGQTTANAALNALLPSQIGQSGKLLKSDGTDTYWDAVTSTATITSRIAASNFTVVAGDLGTLIYSNSTGGTPKANLTAAATLGAGFNCWIVNIGLGNLEIDPFGSETIDENFSMFLRPGEGTQILCDGANWYALAKKTMRVYAENMTSGYTRPTASGSYSVAIGSAASAAYTSSYAIGQSATASANNEIALGGSSNIVKISGAYKLPNTDGTSGQALVTNGSGTLSFSTVGGGGSSAGSNIYLAVNFGGF